MESVKERRTDRRVIKRKMDKTDNMGMRNKLNMNDK
jgi:hypothetical protein